MKIFLKGFALLVLSLFAGLIPLSAQDAVTLEDFPKEAASYSIRLRFYDGSERNYKQLQPTVDKIFPQLRGLSIVEKGGDLQLVVEVDQYLEYMLARSDARYEQAVLFYFTLVGGSGNRIQNAYFQPLTLSLRSAGGNTLFSLRTIGRLFSPRTTETVTALSSGSSVGITPVRQPQRYEEEQWVLPSVRFLQIHLKDLIRFQGEVSN